MSTIAQVKEIWRYPVKSMGGERISTGFLSAKGLAGDRLWAVLDKDSEIKSARQWPKLIQMKASFSSINEINADTYAAAVPDIEISIPGHNAISSRTAETNNALTAFLGHECHLEALRPASDSAFYTPPNDRDGSNLDVELDKLDDEGDFDFSETPEEMFDVLSRFMTPPGTFFDSLPLHILSTQIMAHLAAKSSADADRRRFRPNILLDFPESGSEIPEFELVGKRIRIGEAVIKIRAKTIRCSIPSRAQPLLELEHDPGMTRAMVKVFERHIGVYANIEAEGAIEVGAPVELLHP
jgi:uncharacterized protein YcbX